MMERHGDSQVSMMIVDLDEFAPASHPLRQIKSKVDFTFIYDKVKHLYKAGGRPSEPVVMIKMWLAYRWFLEVPGLRPAGSTEGQIARLLSYGGIRTRAGGGGTSAQFNGFL